MIKEYNTLSDSFFIIFKGIPDACRIMQNSYSKLTKPQQSKLKKQASENVATCSNLYAETFGIPAANTLFVDLIGTLNNLFLSLPENDRVVIATQIIRRMQYIAPYLNITVEKEFTEDGRLKIGNTTYSTDFALTHKIIESWCGWNETYKSLAKNKLYEDYIINCFDAYTQFFNAIDGIFLDYDINLMQLQQETGVNVWQRDSITLKAMGYKSPVSIAVPGKTVNGDPIKNIPVSLRECFPSEEQYSNAVGILHKTKPCIVDYDMNYKYGKRGKTAISEWVRYIKGQPNYGFKFSSNKKLVPLLNAAFNGLEMGKDGRTLDNMNKEYAGKIKAIT